MCDRDLVTLFPQRLVDSGDSPDDLVTEEKPGYLPDLMAGALGVGTMQTLA